MSTNLPKTHSRHLWELQVLSKELYLSSWEKFHVFLSLIIEKNQYFYHTSVLSDKSVVNETLF